MLNLSSYWSTRELVNLWTPAQARELTSSHLRNVTCNKLKITIAIGYLDDKAITEYRSPRQMLPALIRYSDARHLDIIAAEDEEQSESKQGNTV